MKMILIPEYFAHGFITLEDDTELIYHHTEFYKPDCERGIHYKDDRIGINWPLTVEFISEKDNSYLFHPN
jgi:dTDP-4-dehydrorhamnose 3,5-epimerase